MDKRTILSNSQFDRKVSTQLANMAEDKESFAATIQRGRQRLNARRNIKRNIDRWCDIYRQIKDDIDAQIEALCADDIETPHT